MCFEFGKLSKAPIVIDRKFPGNLTRPVLMTELIKNLTKGTSTCQKPIGVCRTSSCNGRSLIVRVHRPQSVGACGNMAAIWTLFLVPFFLLALKNVPTEASHFRGGTISWKPSSDSPLKVLVRARCRLYATD